MVQGIVYCCQIGNFAAKYARLYKGEPISMGSKGYGHQHKSKMGATSQGRPCQLLHHTVVKRH